MSSRHATTIHEIAAITRPLAGLDSALTTDDLLHIASLLDSLEAEHRITKSYSLYSKEARIHYHRRARIAAQLQDLGVGYARQARFLGVSTSAIRDWIKRERAAVA